MYNYIMESDDIYDTISISQVEKYKEERKPARVFIKYDKSYEMLVSDGNDVISIEVNEYEITKSILYDISIEDVVVNIFSAIGCSELCSKEEFMCKYNTFMEDIYKYIGC